MGDQRYGAKCHLCQHVLHPREVEELRWPVQDDCCQPCHSCQEEEFYGALIRACGGESMFDPEVRAALQAFRWNRPNPLIDKLRAEMQGPSASDEPEGAT